MAEAITPAQLVAKWRAEDKKRIDELEKRIERLEQHCHVQSPSAVHTGGVQVPGE